jgi:hypothetical protein
MSSPSSDLHVPHSPTRTLRSAQRQSRTTPPPPTPTRRSRKERANPSVTPRKFRKFFTPRSAGPHTNSSRQALIDITAPNNRNVIQSSPIRPSKSDETQENTPSNFPRDLKRRKLVHTPDSSPKYKRSRRRGSAAREEEISDDITATLQSSPCIQSSRRSVIGEESEEEQEELVAPQQPVERIVPLVDRGLAGRLLELSIGNSSRGTRQRFEYPINGKWNF